ncbi:uncharacterized protein BDW43DRAFT_288294 [Aspergillus alliaceus]|uniref:uncharacterized protein n=1 Tax=Petromyces alliaceus TaxID=209559 RepID=UPI0012A6CF91|nr:uncharacterized protein BDW43DRAFT_288294 [Aspergillus alliaceus]KAB8229391.1 hypothetical protein BDW43DRAFT_288294 [Aspergillus alliaceus]
MQRAIPETKPLFTYSHTDPEWANRKRTPQEVVSLIDEAGISHICLSAWHRPGSAIFSNEEGVKYTRAFPDHISGRGSVDLHDPVNAVKELKYYVKVENFKGLRIVPCP